MDADDPAEELSAAEIAAADISAAYVDALGAGDTGTLVALLAGSPVFVSPFNTWTSRRAVISACTARTAAFADVTVGTAVREGETLCVRWQAHVGSTPVEGVDVLTLGPSGVTQIDVFLRPASALGEIHDAMKAAWPRPVSS